MSSLGLGTIDKMRIVHIDACAEALYEDMADQWILDVENNVNQLFLSWDSRIGMKDDDYDIWSSDIWHALGNEDNYENAEDYAYKDPNNHKREFIRGKRKYYGFYQITFTSQGNQQ
jgi:hypothetical protein